MDHETLGAALALAKKTLADPAMIEEKVEEWLDDHPEATTTVQDGAISYSKLDSSLKEKADEVSQLSNAISELQDCFVESAIPGLTPVTVTNTENISGLYEGVGTSIQSGGFTSCTLSNGVATYTGGTGEQTSPYLAHNGAWGSKKWICGFKYKFTKLVPSLGDPDRVRIHLGASQYYDSQIAWGEWVDFAQTATVDLTRIRLSARLFATAPATNTFTVEIKDIYLYDATDISADMCNYIMEQQSANYQDGTVTYGTDPGASYTPDTTLAISGKAADSKTVGDAISALGASTEELINDKTELTVQTLQATMQNKSALSNLSAYTGLSRSSIATNLATYIPSSTPDTSPSIRDFCGLGTKTWLVSFKFKLTKLDSNLGSPQNIRLYLGNNYYIDYGVAWDNWVEICEVAKVDLTRVYLILRNFAVAPTASQLKLEIKDYYAYDVSSVNADLLTAITKKQSTNYTDGSVTYTTEAFSSSLQSDIRTINVKNYGVKGDGTTDDTATIRKLFAVEKGNFYFPSGTYRITGTLEIPEKSTVYGDGEDTVIDMHSCDNLIACVFRASSSDKIYPYIFTQGENVTIRKIKVIGNDTTHIARHAGIAILDTKNCTIEDTTVYNVNTDVNQSGSGTAYVSGYGICVTRSQFVNVERCYVEKCGYECIGIVDDCDSCVVRDCYTKDGWRCCIQVHRGSCNTLIENCYMKQTNPEYHSCFTVHGEPDQKCKNLRVINCTMECTQNGSQPIDYCSPAQIMAYAECLVFSGNRITGGKRAFYIAGNSNNAKIIGNDFNCNEDSDYGVTISALSTIVIGNCLANEASTPANVITNNPVLMGNIGIS